MALFKSNQQAIKDHLLKEHKFGLSREDQDGIDYVYQVFFEAGPALDYSFGGFFGGRETPTYSDLMSATDAQGKNWSFLATEENFQLIREMEKNNLIVPITGDFGGPKALRAVARYLKTHGATVTAFYTSNVEQYLFQQNDAWRRFYANAAALPIDGTSVFIRSVSNRGLPAQGPGFGLRAQTKLCSIGDLLKAYSRGTVTGYYDVISMSH